MSLELKVMAELKEAMKAKDDAALRGLRAIKAEIIKAKRKRKRDQKQRLKEEKKETKKEIKVKTEGKTGKKEIKAVKTVQKQR